jgi:hypothetical protein
LRLLSSPSVIHGVVKETSGRKDEKDKNKRQGRAVREETIGTLRAGQHIRSNIEDGRQGNRQNGSSSHGIKQQKDYLRFGFVFDPLFLLQPFLFQTYFVLSFFLFLLLNNEVLRDELLENTSHEHRESRGVRVRMT